MPNKLKPDKTYVSFVIRRELLYKVQQYCETIEVERSTYFTALLEHEMQRLGVELNEEYSARVAKESASVQSKRRYSWNRLTPTAPKKVDLNHISTKGKKGK